MSEGQIRELIAFVDWPLIAAFGVGLLLASLIWDWRHKARLATAVAAARALTAAAAGEQHQARLATVLTSFKDQLSDFRTRVETVYTTETRDRASLLTEVRNLQKASDRINREAENLTRALKGDVKA